MVQIELETISSSVSNDVTKRNNTDNKHCYEDALELAGNGKYNYIMLTACSLVNTAVALDIFGFSIVVTGATCDLQLTMEQKGLLSSIPFAGILFAFPWGYFADTCGRRKALMWSMAVGFVFAALTSLATKWYVMLVLKLIGCSFTASGMSVTMTYLGECTGVKHRGQYLQVMNSLNLASEAVSFVLALLVLPLDFSPVVPWLDFTFRPWRLLTFLMALPLGISFLLILYLHESPKFLANLGDEDKALEVLEDIHRVNNGKENTVEYPVKRLILNELQDAGTKTKNVGSFKSLAQQTLPIFKPPLLRKTLQLFYLVVVICSTNNVFIMWFPTIVNSFYMSMTDEDHSSVQSFCVRINDNGTIVQSDEHNMVLCNDIISKETIYSGIGYGVFFMVVNLLVAQVAHYRKPLLISLFTISAVSCVLLNLIHVPIANFIFYVLLQDTAIGLGIAASYFVDLFPTSYSAMATSLGLMVGRIGSFVGINLIGSVIIDHCSMTFYCWSIFVLSGVIVTIFLPSGKV